MISSSGWGRVPASTTARIGRSPKLRRIRTNPLFGLAGTPIASLAGIPLTENRGRLQVVTKERIEVVLLKVRPFLQADGGDIELLEVEGNSASVRLTGMCVPPLNHLTS